MSCEPTSGASTAHLTQARNPRISILARSHTVLLVKYRIADFAHVSAEARGVTSKPRRGVSCGWGANAPQRQTNAPQGSYRYLFISPSTTPIAGAWVVVRDPLSQWPTIRPEVIRCGPDNLRDDEHCKSDSTRESNV